MIKILDIFLFGIIKIRRILSLTKAITTVVSIWNLHLGGKISFDG